MKTVRRSVAAFLLLPALLLTARCGVPDGANEPAPVSSVTAEERISTSAESVEITETVETEDVVYAENIAYPEPGDLYARLSIPSCGIEDDVYFNDDEASLNKGLGQFSRSGLPGFGRPILIAGHNNHAFHTLGNAAVGDIVTVTTGYGVYEYRITEGVIREATSFTREELLRDEEILILYTCYPFSAMYTTSQRYFVYAEKISGPKVLHEGDAG